MTVSADLRPLAALPDRTWRVTLSVIAAALLAVLIVHLDTVVEIVTMWQTRTYAYAWAVLPSLAFVLWHNRVRLAALAPSTSLFGIVAATLCAMAWVAGDLTNIAVARQLALVMSLCAVVLAGVGWSVFRRLSPFLATLFFLVPTADLLIYPLKLAALGIVQAYTRLVGLPFEHNGFSLLIGEQEYVIIDDCAGLEYIVGGMFVGLVLSLLIHRSIWKNLFLTLLGGAFGIAANGLRIIGIITYDYITGAELTLAQHGYFEPPVLLLAFGGILYVFSRFDVDRQPEEAGGPETDMSAARRGATIALAAFPIALAPFLWQGETQAATSSNAIALPAEIAGWKRLDAVPDWQPKPRSPGIDSSTSAFVKDGQRAVVFVAQTSSQRTKVSGDAIDLRGTQDWLPAGAKVELACARSQCVEVRRSRYLHRDDERVMQVYVAYFSGNNVSASTLAFRMNRAWARIAGISSPARIIAIATESPDTLSAASIAALVQALSTGNDVRTD